MVKIEEIFFSKIFFPKILQPSKYPKIAANVQTSEHRQKSANIDSYFRVHSKLHDICSTSNLVHPSFKEIDYKCSNLMHPPFNLYR